MLSLRDPAAGRRNHWFLTAIALIVGAVLVSACSGGSLNNFFSGSGGGTVSNKLAPVSFSNIIGPPKAVGDQLTSQLISEARQKKIPVVTDTSQPSTYKVQGYLAQSNERSSEKFSYILDVTDKSGKRVHRILGEEAVPAKAGAKPWSSINQAAMQRIAAKTANDLATWLPTQSGSTTAVASSGSSAPPPAARSSKPPPAASASKPTPASTRTAATSNVSGKYAAMVLPVSGAPGDGKSALTKAVKSRLQARGVQIATTGGNDVYRVNGKVTMGPAPGGNQRVQIVWRLSSPTGQNLGTVTQQSDVAKGSLDKSWGPAATAAGNAAAAELLKLMQKNRG